MTHLRIQLAPRPAPPPPVFHLTDIGNGERFAAQHAGRAIYAAGSWWVYDGRRWKRDELNAAEKMAKETALSIYDERKRATDTDASAAIRDWALKTESARALANMLKCARSDPAIARTIADFDADHYALNCKNGTLNLKTGELKPHNPADLITKLCPVAYHADAPASQFHKFLNRIFVDSQPLIAYVQKLLGLACSGETDEQIMPIFYGGGRNGKSTLIDLACEILGDYATVAADSLLSDNGRSEHPTQLADLQGRRLVIASETSKDETLRIHVIKRLTGDATIKARFMGKDYFEFPRTHHLFLVTNNKPRIPEDTEAAWRRLRMIPFTVQIPPEEVVAGLDKKLFAEEAAGILAWMAKGFLNWQEEGLATPPEVETATTSYRTESEPLREFLDDCVTVDMNYQTKRADLRRAYVAYCENQGAKPLSQKFFNERIRAAGARDHRTNSDRWWVGIFIKGGTENYAANPLFKEQPATPPPAPTAGDGGYQGEEGES